MPSSDTLVAGTRRERILTASTSRRAAREATDRTMRIGINALFLQKPATGMGSTCFTCSRG